MKAYLFFTKFNKTYKNLIDEESKKTLKDLNFPGLINSTPIEICYGSELIIVESGGNDIEKRNRSLCICVSDLLHNFDDAIDELFKNIPKNFEIYCYFHNSNNAMKKYVLNNHADRLTQYDSFSHYDVENGEAENPFYALALCTQAENNTDFYDRLESIKNTYLKKEDRDRDRNIEKTKLIYKLIANDTGKETKAMYQKQKEEYEDLPDFPAKIDYTFVRNVRDIIMNKSF